MKPLERVASRPTILVTAGLLCTGILALLGCCMPAEAQPSTAAATAAQIKPVISVNVLMVKFVDQAADAIWSAAATSPKKACEWEQVEYRATQLATTGTLLKVGGTGPLDMMWKDSPRWASFADKMSQVALTAAQAARDKNVAAIKAAGDQLILNCEGCHRAFKPEIPTQNIITHLSHAAPLVPPGLAGCKDQN